MLSWLRQLRCAFSGHWDLTEREPKRLFIRCVDCGRQTKGWNLE